MQLNKIKVDQIVRLPVGKRQIADELKSIECEKYESSMKLFAAMRSKIVKAAVRCNWMRFNWHVAFFYLLLHNWNDDLEIPTAIADGHHLHFDPGQQYFDVSTRAKITVNYFQKTSCLIAT